jgi:hypothetical protein
MIVRASLKVRLFVCLDHRLAMLKYACSIEDLEVVE